MEEYPYCTQKETCRRRSLRILALDPSRFRVHGASNLDFHVDSISPGEVQRGGAGKEALCKGKGGLEALPPAWPSSMAVQRAVQQIAAAVQHGGSAELVAQMQQYAEQYASQSEEHKESGRGARSRRRARRQE